MNGTLPVVSLAVFGGLVAIVALAAFARWVRLPYPVIFVIGGAILAIVPHAPAIRLRPDWIFLIVLPPLLFSGGWSTDWIAFKRNLRPISMLAVGLVIVTTLAVAWVAHGVIRALPWAAAFTLGAVVAPPDPVAAETVMERLAVPSRIATIVSAEGLMNDSVSLVLYAFAVAAAQSGHFSLATATGEFFLSTIGGALIGVAVAWCVSRLPRVIHGNDELASLINSVALLVAPYAAYFPADAAHVSGVLAAVSAGIYLGNRSTRLYAPATRLMSKHFWDMLTMLLNGGSFLLIGFLVPSILRTVNASMLHLAWVTAAIYGTITLVRFAYVFITPFISKLIPLRRFREAEIPSWPNLLFVAWSGMRGIVSLAAALAVPYTARHHPFPARSELVFIAFAMIFGTLVLQGLSLKWLVRRLGLSAGGRHEERSLNARIRALRAALERIDRESEREDSEGARNLAGELRSEYRRRIAHLEGHLAASADEAPADAARAYEMDHRLEHAALEAELGEIKRLRDNGDISENIYRELRYDLDLAFVRLA